MMERRKIYGHKLSDMHMDIQDALAKTDFQCSHFYIEENFWICSKRHKCQQSVRCTTAKVISAYGTTYYLDIEKSRCTKAIEKNKLNIEGCLKSIDITRILTS